MLQSLQLALRFYYDTLGRLASRKIGLSSDYITTLTYVPGNGTNKTTGLVSTYQNGSDAAYSYTYDDNGNITGITQGSTSITYEYDTANRLTRENNGLTNETVTYEYDVWGNILNRKVYAYTVGDLTNVPYTEIEYEYTNSAWGDQLTSYDNTAITYDGMGNPTSYRGYTFGWRGKQLVSAGNSTDSLTYEYNEDGLRQKKTVNNVDTDYFYNGSVLIGMQRGTDKLLFSYDASGNVVSVDFNGMEYYYLRNAQGDIVKLIDASGASVVEYTYDTWGKEVQTTGSLAGTLGSFQPFRYRGYVYDWETGFYYLQSRYYDPTVGRFISVDVFLSTGQGVLGHNAYSYCGDNPVSRIDCNGASWEDFWEWLKSLFGGGNNCAGNGRDVETTMETTAITTTPTAVAIPTPSPNPQEQAVAIAKEYGATSEALKMINKAAGNIGAPYQSPPKDEGTYDCASLVYEAARTIDNSFSGGSCRKQRKYFSGEIGKNRWTFHDAEDSLKKEMEIMMPGDLIYWKGSGSHGHVAIYLGGGNIY